VLIDLGNGLRVDPQKALRDLDRADYEDSLYSFLRKAWRHIDASGWADGWPIEAVAEHLQAVVDGDIRRLIVNIPPRMGKQVADDTPVLTLDGWKTHGELRVGDLVFHPSGKPTKVLAVSEKTPSNVRVEFFDGSVIYCHENHEWTLYNRPARRWETVEARRFLESRMGRWGKTKGAIKNVLCQGRASHQLPTIRALQFPNRELPLHPYVLGAWLGDGSTGKPCVTHAPSDTCVVDKIAALGFKKTAVWQHKDTGVLTTNFGGDTGFRKKLSELGVLNDKHIPKEYLQASIEQRLELLAGLIDTDGHVDKNSRCYFSNSNYALISGTAELVRSFGWHATISEIPPRLSSSGIQGKSACWLLGFQSTDGLAIPTALHRKRIKRWVTPRRRGLKSVTHDPRGKVGHCIQVDAPDGLYLVGKNLIPTHNSSICSVALPAWTWAQPYSGPTSGPGVAFLHASYAQQLSLRDSVKCRRLIESPWYQSLWGERFKLNTDQNTKSRFGNDKGGERLITSIGGAVTGEGGSVIVVDDPNAANEAFSEATIHATIEWWDGTMSTRLNDPKTGAYIIIQQRLAEDDLTGHILSKDVGDWTHLCLPMRYEPERSFMTPIGWSDPRTTPGELLWPSRFGEDEVKLLERQLGPFATAGQLQQRPEPAGGGIIKRDWWQLWEKDSFPPMDFVLASLDTAYTTKQENDFSALTVWGVFYGDPKAEITRVLGPDGRPTNDRTYQEGAPQLVLMSAWQERLELHELVEKVAATCKRCKVDRLIVEDKAAGHSVAQEIRRIYGAEEFAVQLVNPGAQDKVARLYSVQHLWAEGIIYAPERAWSETVITQVGQFPRGKHDDLVDTCSMALRHLRDIGLLTRAPERLQEIEDSKLLTGRPPAPLYPA
jgi:predicted phage terminase large subunit-like protein